MRTLPNGNCYPGFLQVGRPVTFKVQRQVSLTGDDDIDWEQIPIGFIDVIPLEIRTVSLTQMEQEKVTGSFLWIMKIV